MNKQRKYFDTEALKEKENWLQRQTFASQGELEIFLQFLSLPSSSRLLELGSGTGRYTLPLLEKGYSVNAVDFSRESLAVLKETYGKNKKPFWGKLTISPSIKNKKKIDGIIGINVFHHLKNPQATAENLVKRLRPGGIMLVFEPNPYCLFWHLYFFYRRIWFLEKGIFNTSANNLKKIFISVGLKDVTVFHYGLLPTRWLGPFGSKFLFNLFTIYLANLPLLKNLSFHHLVRGVKK